MNAYIEELKDVIRRLHGVESEYVESVPVTETCQGKTVWAGLVEVFDLRSHPNALRIYAWAQDTDDPNHPHRHFTFLHRQSIKSAQDAVRTALQPEFKNGEPAGEG